MNGFKTVILDLRKRKSRLKCVSIVSSVKNKLEHNGCPSRETKRSKMVKKNRLDNTKDSSERKDDIRRYNEECNEDS